jgi:hypothetical protein
MGREGWQEAFCTACGTYLIPLLLFHAQTQLSLVLGILQSKSLCFFLALVSTHVESDWLSWVL